MTTTNGQQELVKPSKQIEEVGNWWRIISGCLTRGSTQTVWPLPETRRAADFQ